MPSESKEKTVGRQEPDFNFDAVTIIFMIIGFITSWINMLIILNTMEVWAYLSIIFTTSIPCILIGLRNRYWGYGYIFTFAIAGIPFIGIDLFIGGYTLATTIFIFIIIWLVFWKTWRALSSINRQE